MAPGTSRPAESARQSVEGGAPVLHVRAPDRWGVVRVNLLALNAEEEATFSLPVTWVAAGQGQGFTLAAAPADRPFEMTITGPEPVNVTAP